MRSLARVIPQADFTWSQHFLGLIENGDRPSSNLIHDMDHHRSVGLDLKSYIVRRGGGESTTQNEWDNAVTKLDSNNAIHHAIKDFLADNPEGKLSSPLYVDFLLSFPTRAHSL